MREIGFSKCGTIYPVFNPRNWPDEAHSAWATRRLHSRVVAWEKWEYFFMTSYTLSLDAEMDMVRCLFVRVGYLSFCYESRLFEILYEIF